MVKVERREWDAWRDLRLQGAGEPLEHVHLLSQSIQDEDRDGPTLGACKSPEPSPPEQASPWGSAGNGQEPESAGFLVEFAGGRASRGRGDGASREEPNDVPRLRVHLGAARCGSGSDEARPPRSRTSSVARTTAKTSTRPEPGLGHHTRAEGATTMKHGSTTRLEHPVVSREEWLRARTALLAREKEHTRLRDELSRQRRELPWVRIDKVYRFDGPDGEVTLAELFEDRRQLLVQHFMLGPGWEQGCPSCSFMADHTDGMNVHLAQRDITLVAISRAPLAEIERFRRRMGWQFKWVSSHGSDFNYDFHVSFTPEEEARGEVHYNYDTQPFESEELPGVSVFYKDDAGEVFHTYSTYRRGVEVMMGAYNLMDLTPKGRDEDDLDFTMAWLRHHDRYGMD